MDMLNNVLGGQQGQQQLQDFANRWQSGNAHEIPTAEVADHYGTVATNLTPDQYQQAAQEAFTRLSPDQRAQFAQWLQSQTQQHGVNVPALGGGTPATQLQDPGQLAQVTTQVHQQQPGLLQQLLGKGGTGGPLDNPVAKIALAGITAVAAQRLMGGGR